MSKKYLTSIIFLLLAACIAGYQEFAAQSKGSVVSASATTTVVATDQIDRSSSSTVALVEANATVTHVVDGDTIDARYDDGTEVRVRLLGVNTPETVDPRKTVECFGKEASNFSKKTLSEKRIRLNPDPQADDRDKYGRVLRNIVLEDGTDFNALLVSEGYAYAYTGFPLNPARKVELIRLQKEATDAGKGLWAPGACR